MKLCGIHYKNTDLRQAFIYIWYFLILIFPNGSCKTSATGESSSNVQVVQPVNQGNAFTSLSRMAASWPLASSFLTTKGIVTFGKLNSQLIT